MRRKLFIICVFSFFIIIFCVSILGLSYTLSPDYKAHNYSNIEKINYNLDINEDKLMQKLNLSSSFPKVLDVKFCKEIFFIFTDKGVYTTTDFITYKKLSKRFNLSTSNCLVSSTDFIFYSAQSKKIYKLNDSLKFKKVSKIKNFSISNSCMINGRLYQLTNKVKKPHVKYHKNFAVIQLPTKTFYNLKTDGLNLYAVTKDPVDGDFLPLYSSANGLTWTRSEPIVPALNPDGYSVKRIDDKVYLKTTSNDAINSSNYYQLSYSDDEILIEVLFSYYNTKILQVTDENLKIFNIFSTDNNDSTYYGMTTNSDAKLLDIPILRQLKSFSGKFVFCDNTLYFVGEYGVIYNSLDTFNWSWLGMYSRTPYTKYIYNTTLKPNLGLFKTGPYIWLNLSNTVTNFNDHTPYPLLYCTKNGINWYTINTNLEDYVDILRNKLDLYAVDNTLYYFNKADKTWWTTNFSKSGDDVTTIKMQYSNSNLIYEETGLKFPLGD